MNNLTAHDPFAETGFDELFRGFFRPVRTERAPVAIKMDVTEMDNAYVVKAEIPGVANAKREILLTEGGAAHLVTGDQEADGIKFRKWLMITRRTITSNSVDLTFAFVVTVQVPVEAHEIYTDEIVRKALASVTLRGAIPSAEILDKMPFKLNELADFKGVRSIMPGNWVSEQNSPS